MSRDESTRSRLNVPALVALVALLAIGAFAVTMRPAHTELVDASAAADLDKFAAIEMSDAVDRVAGAIQSDSRD